MVTMGLLITLIVVGLLIVALRSAEDAVTAAVITALVVSALFPSFTPSAAERALATLGSTVILAAAYLRSQRAEKQAWPPGAVLFVLFVTVTSIANAAGGDAERVSIMLSQGVFILTLLATATRLSERGRWAVLVALGLLGAVQFIVAAGEQFLGTPAMWPRVNGTDDITNRPNYFSDALAGRSLGTTSMMITLGAFVGASFLACLKLAGRRRRGIWLFLAALSVATIIFSGTRSAVLATGAALIVWIFLAWRSYQRVFAIIGLVLATLAAAQFNVSALLGFSNFETSLSFVHRAGVISSIGALLDMPSGVLFGHGGVGASQILQESLAGARGVPAFDNTYVRELAVSGLVGAVLLIGFMLRVLLSGSRMSKVFIVFFAAMGMSFDLFTWNLMFVLVALTVAGALSPETQVTTRTSPDLVSPALR